LSPGESSSFYALAHRRRNHSGIALEQGGRYRFRIEPLDVWYDDDIAADPIEGWGRGKFSSWRKLVRWLGRESGASSQHDLMVLMGEIGDEDQGLFAFADHVTAEQPSANAAEGSFEARADGELFAFANDSPWFYGNNCGYVRVTVERVAVSEHSGQETRIPGPSLVNMGCSSVIRSMSALADREI
jgi:hypothetical protein